MKMAFSRVLTVFLVSIALGAWAAPPASVQITVQIKREKESEVNNGQDNTAAVKTEKVSYALTLKNVSFHDLPDLKLNSSSSNLPDWTVEYIFFVERQKLGEKKTSVPDVQRIFGLAKLDTLKSQASTSVTTKTILLKTSNLVGAYHYENGGRIKAEDSIAGFWVRVMQDGTVLGEYRMPSSVAQRGWEKE